MRQSRALQLVGLEEVSWLPPAVGLGLGAMLVLSGHAYVGIGIATGGTLAYLNTGLLVRRIHFAAESGNDVGAMISMQIGLLLTFTVVGGLTVAMALVSVSMTVAMAVSFFVSQTLELALYYLAHRGRSWRAAKLRPHGSDRP